MSDLRLYRVMRNLEGKHCGNEYLGNLVVCGECKHSCHLEDGTRLFCDSIKGLAMVVSADDYCSYGEREGE